MPRPKSEPRIGDRIRLIANRKCTGVVVFKQDQDPNDVKWSVHLYNCDIKGGFYRINEIEKMFSKKETINGE